MVKSWNLWLAIDPDQRGRRVMNLRTSGFNRMIHLIEEIWSLRTVA